MLQFLPYALAALGGVRGYQGARSSGASGIGRILGGALGAFTGYNLGQTGGFAANAGFQSPFAQSGPASILSRTMSAVPGGGDPNMFASVNQKKGISSILNILRKGGEAGADFSPGRVSAALAAGTYLGGAFDNQPTDIFMPGYNMNYLNLRDQRPGYTYIDPTTGQEKTYEKMYAPEEAGIGDRRMGPYSMNVQRLRTGGIAEIKKFNEGGINYLPSKVSHDENDATNYVRASGYVEDGAGVGDKDEDTMLAQLADGEFVTRADGVLGAGIIAGGNPNSMKDMREKGAQYFYEQQKRYKRVFDLLKDKNGISKEKTN